MGGQVHLSVHLAFLWREGSDMALATRADIKAQIYEFLPQINQTSKQTLIENCINLAVEEISLIHDFRSLRAATPDEASLVAGAYYLDLNASSFSVMYSSTVTVKDILEMFWRKEGTSDYGRIRFLDDSEFHRRYGYYDDSSREGGEPIHYTRLGDRLIFNCPARTALIIRCFYQKVHPPFASDGDTHSFGAKSNTTALFAIVYRALLELKSSLNSLEFPQEMSQLTPMAQKYASDLVSLDKYVVNEEFEIGWAETTEGGFREDAYGWVG